MTGKSHNVCKPMLMLAALCLVGCHSYQLQGVVIEGPSSTVLVVDETDPRLSEGDALPMASVDIVIDPDKLSRKSLPRGISDVDGRFSVPVDEPGAGFLEYDIRVLIRRSGFNSAVQDLRIPGPNKRLLITLVNGEDLYQPDPQDIVEETLEMSEPYLR